MLGGIRTAAGHAVHTYLDDVIELAECWMGPGQLPVTQPRLLAFQLSSQLLNSLLKNLIIVTIKIQERFRNKKFDFAMIFRKLACLSC